MPQAQKLGSSAPPRVSVLLSAWNSEQTIERAVRSILDQTYKNFEFLICDDASTDQTPKILENLALTDRRIKLIKNSQNLGLTRSLNALAALAEGEYLARQDADDISKKGRLEAEIQFLDQNPETVLIGTWADLVTPAGKFLRTQSPLPADIKNLARRNCIPHGSWLLRRSVFHQAGGYDPTMIYAQDYDFLLRLRNLGKLSIIPYSHYVVQVGGGNVSTRHWLSQAWCVARIRSRGLAFHSGGLTRGVLRMFIFAWTVFVDYRLGYGAYKERLRSALAKMN